MNNKNIITVEQGENYDCNSIKEALKTEENNGKIFINGGVYNEELNINKEIEKLKL